MRIENGISLFLCIMSVTSCNLEVNTSDPQASTDIESSRKDGFLVRKYEHFSDIDSLFKIQEAWIEHSWKYSLVGNKKVKEKFDDLQFDFKLSKFKGPFFRDDNYLVDWRIQNDTNEYVGQSNGVYVLFLKGTEIPKKISFTVRKLNEDTSFKTQFFIGM
jgi:hypothetical protein